MPYALAASVAASALLWWGTITPSVPPHTFETLTNPTPAGAAVSLRVVFAPGVTEAERRELLDSHSLTVIGPPAEDGVVTLAFPGDADRAAIVAALKQDPRIRLVTTPPGSDGP